jgi:hypothetical protein
MKKECSVIAGFTIASTILLKYCMSTYNVGQIPCHNIPYLVITLESIPYMTIPFHTSQQLVLDA